MKKIIYLLLLNLVFANPAFADNDRDDHDNGHHEKDKHHKRDERAEERASFHDEDRARVNRYYRHRIGYRSCPPGLAKKYNGCLPPGQHRNFARGEYIPANYVIQPVPNALLLQMYPAPANTTYGMSDNNLYLISQLTRQVLDSMAIQGY